MTPDAILHALRTPTRHLPTAALVAAMDQPEAVVPGLLALVDEALADPEVAEHDGHLYALYLLAQFREPRALEPALTLLRLPADLQECLLGDCLNEGMPSILASLCVEAPSTLEVTAADPALDPLARSVAMDALLVLGFEGHLDEPAFRKALDRLLGLYEARGREESPEAWAFLMATFSTAGYPEYLPRLRAAYEAGLVDAEILDLEDLEAALRRSPAHYRRRFLRSHHTVRDAVLDLEEQSWLFVEEAVEAAENEEDET